MWPGPHEIEIRRNSPLKIIPTPLDRLQWPDCLDNGPFAIKCKHIRQHTNKNIYIILFQVTKIMVTNIYKCTYLSANFACPICSRWSAKLARSQPCSLSHTFSSCKTIISLSSVVLSSCRTPSFFRWASSDAILRISSPSQIIGWIMVKYLFTSIVYIGTINYSAILFPAKIVDMGNNYIDWIERW